MAKIDLTGQRFGRLEVLHETEKKGKGKDRYWRCLCDCGEFTSVNQNFLRRGVTKSCGCLSSETMTKVANDRITTKHSDLIGKKFGMLTVIKKARKTKNRAQWLWLCKCDCGNEKEVTTGQLRNMMATSCGCTKKERKKGEKKKYIRKGYKRSTRESRNIYPNTDGKFRVILFKNGKQKSLGVFDTFEQAKKARDIAEKVIWDVDELQGVPANTLDLEKKTFGKLRVIERVKSNEKGNSMWLCKCKCGNVGIYYGTGLNNGSITSCGCSKTDQMAHARNQLASKDNPDGMKLPLISKKVRSDSQTGHKGVTRRVARDGRKERYEAHIRIEGKRIHLGSSTNIDEAIKMRRKGEEKYYGKYIADIINRKDEK